MNASTIGTGIPADRVDQLFEITAVVVDLASDDASNVNGETLYADGTVTTYMAIGI